MTRFRIELTHLGWTLFVDNVPQACADNPFNLFGMVAYITQAGVPA